MEINDPEFPGYFVPRDGMEIDSDCLYYVGAFFPRKPGLMLFCIRFEHEYFPPDDPDKNKQFQIVLTNWKEMIWMVIEFPKEYEETAKKLVEETGLRIARGVPAAIDEDGIHPFPVNGPNVFTLQKAASHPVYFNKPAEIIEALALEDAAIERILERHEDARSEKNLAHLN
jgi:hypothetical protein